MLALHHHSKVSQEYCKLSRLSRIRQSSAFNMVDVNNGTFERKISENCILVAVRKLQFSFVKDHRFFETNRSEID